MPSEWNHRICERCWFNGPGWDEQQAAYRRPTQVTGDAPGFCCYCGGLTVTGIYVRADPKTLHTCNHTELSWTE